MEDHSNNIYTSTARHGHELVIFGHSRVETWVIYDELL